VLPFDHTPRTRLVYGPGALQRLGQLVQDLGGQRVLVVSDPGITKAGYPQRALDLIRAAGLQAQLFDQVRENPSTEDVDACVTVAREFAADLLIGLGGGSSLDTAKGCNFLLTNGGRMADYWGTGKAAKPMLPMIAVPTTAGTGSECQSYALISDAVSHVKMACGDPKAAARIAVLDPELTLSQPHRVTVCTGIDALTHAIESAVTKKRSALSLLYSREAFRLLNDGFPRVIAAPQDLEARGQMLLGAALAGLAIENSMLGAAHSCANPLTASFGIVHGEAVGLMMPHIIRYNQAEPAAASTYAELYAGDLADRMTELLTLAKMPLQLTRYGIQQEHISDLASQAAKQWTAGFNPRPVDEVAFREIYTAALG
jgi:alcohol dehydrogenase